jgi:CubicO group peptidase (beta-lactamase class C family)
MEFKTFNLALVSAALSLTTMQPVMAKQSEKQQSLRAANARMAALFADFSTANSPGCTYAVRQNGKAIAQASFGSANIAAGKKLTSDMPMNIGSVSKSFTAAAVLSLIRAGKVKPADTVKHHFPDLPEWAGRVSVADLIHMRSGIPDFLERPSDGARVDNSQGATQLFGTNKSLFDTVSFAEVYASIKKTQALAFEPGSKFGYSNANYTLLAKLVEKTSGMGIEAYLKANVLPHALKGRVQEGRLSTNIYTVPGAPMGYYKADGGTDWLPRQETWDVRGPSSIFIRIGDLARWGDTFSLNPTAKGSFQDAQITPGIFTGDGDEKAGYAYGLFVTKIGGEDVIYHPGGTEQFTSGLYTVPSKRLSFAYSCNIRAQELVGALQNGPSAEAMKRYGYDVVFRTWIGK